jgi:beta-barrel assembly-enhancing protease
MKGLLSSAFKGFIGLSIAAHCHALGNMACEGEREQARTKAERIENEWPLRGSDAVSHYVRELGERLTKEVSGSQPTRWRFNVVRDYSANAFTIGDGFIYVTDGAVRFSASEDELAAILAHEIGHQLAGHFCGLSPQSAANRSGKMFDWFRRARPSRIEHEAVGSLSLATDLAKELEADRISVQILNSAGYDPHAMLEVARRIPAGSSSFSHLRDRERISALEKLLAHLPRRLGQTSERFQELKRELMGE